MVVMGVSESRDGLLSVAWVYLLLHTHAIELFDTVDGKNPAPPGMYKPCK